MPKFIRHADGSWHVEDLTGEGVKEQAREAELLAKEIRERRRG